jgi:hypothetical protein
MTDVVKLAADARRAAQAMPLNTLKEAVEGFRLALEGYPTENETRAILVVAGKAAEEVYAERLAQDLDK